MRKTILLALPLAALLLTSGTPRPAEAAGAVNLYSYRQPFLIKPILAEFTKRTGIKVNIVFATKGLIEKIRATPGAADAVLTEDLGRLHDLQLAGLLAPVHSKELEKNIPPEYRHPEGMWFGLTVRGRVIWTSRKRVKPGEITTYEDLTDPKWKGRICIRSGKHAYNLFLLASIIAHKGHDAAKAWLEGLRDNLARKPQGNDRAQAKAIYAGECDVAVGNTYYVGKMLTNPRQKKWGEAIRIVFPNQKGRGTHVDISGASVLVGARNRANAIKLIEFLSEDYAQKLYANQNFEYPIRPGIPVNQIVKSWGDFKADSIGVAKIAQFRAEASKLVDEVNFNNPGVRN